MQISKLGLVSCGRGRGGIVPEVQLCLWFFAASHCCRPACPGVGSRAGRNYPPFCLRLGLLGGYWTFWRLLDFLEVIGLKCTKHSVNVIYALFSFSYWSCLVSLLLSLSCYCFCLIAVVSLWVSSSCCYCLVVIVLLSLSWYCCDNNVVSLLLYCPTVFMFLF